MRPSDQTNGFILLAPGLHKKCGGICIGFHEYTHFCCVSSGKRCERSDSPKSANKGLLNLKRERHPKSARSAKSFFHELR
jgi:hypothetical protein